jgi:hypothetical protein
MRRHIATITHQEIIEKRCSEDGHKAIAMLLIKKGFEFSGTEDDQELIGSVVCTINPCTHSYEYVQTIDD